LTKDQATLDNTSSVAVGSPTILFVRSTARMHGRLFLGLAVLVTAISVGCGGAGAGASGDNASQVLAAGELAVSPSTVDFGKVAVGTLKSKTGTLTAGDSRITVTSADWSGEGYALSGVVFPLTLHAGQSVPFKVTFAPHRAGSSAGKISFQSDAEHATQAAFSGNGSQTTGHSVTLSWHPAAAKIVGYNVYRGAASKGPYARINASPHPKPTFTDASVLGGETYFYMTTAVSKNGKESKRSNLVRVTIPNS
jgi:hypothetical protein